MDDKVMVPKIQLNILIDETLKFELKKKALEEKRDMQDLITDLIARYLQEHGAGNPAFRLTNWINNTDFKITPAYMETTQKWINYLDKCNKKELEEIENRALFLREQARSRWYKSKNV